MSTGTSGKTFKNTAGRKSRGDPAQKYLLRTETTVFSVRRHWASLAETAGWLALYWAGALLALTLLGGVGIIRLIGICFLFFSLCWFAWQLLDWRVERFLVTNRRVLLISGLLTRKVAIMPLIKVTDLTYQQSPAGRVLGYGSFIIESAGQHQALSRIDFLPQPQQRYQQVSALLFGTVVDLDPDDEPGRQVTVPVPAVPPRPRSL